MVMVIRLEWDNHIVVVLGILLSIKRFGVVHTSSCAGRSKVKIFANYGAGAAWARRRTSAGELGRVTLMHVIMRQQQITVETTISGVISDRKWLSV